MNGRRRPSYPLRSSTCSLPILAALARFFFTRRMMPDVSSLDPPQAAPFAAADASATAPERTSRRPAPAATMP